MTAPLQLLIVDDNEDDARVVCTQLRLAGFRVVPRVESTPEGVATALKEQSFDIAFVDYQIPGYSGLEAAASVRTLRPDVPIVMLSGYVGEEAAVHAMRLGIRDFLHKNNLERLSVVVARELEESAARREQRAAESLRIDERLVLEMVVCGASLNNTLEVLTRAYRSQQPAGRAAILVHSPQHERWCVADPSMPADFPAAVAALAPEPLIAASTSSSRGRTLLSPHDEGRWPKLAALAARSGFSSVFIEPIRGRENKLLGALLCHYEDNHAPPPREVELIERLANLAALAIDHRFAYEALTNVNEQLETKIRERTAQLEKARALAEAGSAAKTTFLTSMSHEIRTPMNAILGFTQLLTQEQGYTPKQKEWLEAIESSGRHLLALINDVLAMSRIEAGQLQLNNTRCDVRAVLNEIDRMFRMRAESKGLKLHIEVSERVPRAAVLDEGKLRQILINLVGNAVKFTERGSVTISIEATDDTLSFAIADTGIGIAPALQQSVFEPFFQCGDEAQRLLGTGLGLTISQRCAKLMNGSLELQSQPGAGCLFRLDVPYEFASGRQSTRPPNQELRFSEEHTSIEVLIVDDNYLNRLLLTQHLKPLGFSLREAENGADAVNAFEQKPADLVLMDMAMPIMDGYAATRRIRTLDHGDSAKIIAVTASSFEEEVSRMRAAGTDDVLCKPFGKRELTDLLERHLVIKR